MTAPDCGDPTRCPVPDPVGHPNLNRLRTVAWGAGTVLHRGHRRTRAATALTPGLGDTRFAPLAGIAHAYVSSRLTVALLESVLHHLSGPDPTIYLAELTSWVASQVATRHRLRLIDLRDPALADLGLSREQLADTDPAHYPCTRQWADHLHGRRIGGHPTHGFVWHSRQADLHRRSQPTTETGAPLTLVGDLLHHDAVEVAVIHAPEAPTDALSAVGTPVAMVDPSGRPARIIVELSALLGAPIL